MPESFFEKAMDILRRNECFYYNRTKDTVSYAHEAEPGFQKITTAYLENLNQSDRVLAERVSRGVCNVSGFAQSYGT